MNDGQMLDAADVAGQLGRTPRWVNKAAKTGVIGGFKVGKYWRFRQEDVDAYLQRAYSRPADPMARTGASAARRRVS